VLMKFFKAKFYLYILLPTLLLGFSGEVKAENNAMMVQTIGTGIIRGKDVEAARDEALSNAMVSSVQSALADLIPMEIFISNFKKLDESVFENIGDYILEYKILAENTSGKTYRIMVEATLFEEKIREMLSTLETVSAETDLPKVLFFLAEQNFGDILPLYWWGEDPSFVKGHSENAIANVLIEQGFSILDHEGMLLYQPGKAYVNNPYLSNQEAIQMGHHLNADIVVVGTAIVEIAPRTIGLNTRSFIADLSMRAIRIDTGEEIASVDQQSVKPNGDTISGGRDALSHAGTLAGKSLAPQIAQAWKNSKTKFLEIEIFVKGTSDLGNFVNFRKSLSQLPGVNNVRIKETMADEALLLIDYTGSAQTLAETLMQRSFEDFGINIFEVGWKHISMDLLRSQRVP
jgi:hypothetical protein